MSLIVLVDMRENNGHVIAITDDECENIEQFESREEVNTMMAQQPLCTAFPCIVVDLDNGECDWV